MSLERLGEDESQAFITEWRNSLSELFDLFEGWAQHKGYQCERSTTEIVEHQLGTYEAPVLTIQRGKARFVVEPIARMIIGGTGRVDFYSYPSLAKLIFLRSQESEPENRQWNAYADTRVLFSPVQTPGDLDRIVEAFV